MDEKIVRENRIERLRRGIFAFGCPVPDHTEEEHDEFCKYPTQMELIRAHVSLDTFVMESRRVCGYIGLFGRRCNFPKDHEMHDYNNARRAGWSYHPFHQE